MTAVHTAILQPEEFELMPKCDKPTAKLGKVIDTIKKYRKMDYSIYDAIVQACIDVDYFSASIDKHIKDIIKKGFKYYWTSRFYNDNQLTLDNKSHNTAVACIESMKSNQQIMSKLHPIDIFGDELPSFNEDTLFLDYIVLYKGMYTILHMKGKIDNWTIDLENKIIVLNDLKTTGKPIAWFMNPEYGSLKHYHYLRQFALYGQMLKEFASNEFGYSKDWKFYCNVLAVETVEDHKSSCFYITPKQLAEGEYDLMRCLKRIAYYEIFGHEEEVEFI